MSSVLPPGWAETKLENLVEILDRKRVPVNAKERAERLAAAKTTYPYYGATGQVGEIDDFIFEGESVLLGEDGVPFFDPYKHKAYLVSGRYWVNNHAHVLRGNGAVNNRFLTHQLNVVDYRQYVSGTTRLKLTQASMKDLPLRVPPIREQERIVEKIETLFAELDKGEESLRHVQTLLARYRQSVLKAAVTGELTADWRAERAGKLEHGRDLLERILDARRESWQGRGKYKEPIAPDAQKLSELPDGWVWATAEQLGFVVSGQTPRRVEEHVSPTGHIPWFKVSSMNEPGNEVELLESRWMFDQAGAALTKLALIPQGAIVFPKRGGAILTNKKRRMGRPGSIDLNLMAFVPTGIDRYIWSFFQFLDLRSIYDGSNVPQINYKDIAYVPVAVPTSLEEAEVIADRVQHLLEHRERLESVCRDELARSAALRQSILKDAFSGRLVPQDPNDEPASELLARIHQSHKPGLSRPDRRKPAAQA